MAENNQIDQKRQHFRLEFPADERPALQLASMTLEVLDISEGGCSVHCDQASFNRLSRPGTRVRGVLKLVTGEKIDVEGEVLRTAPNLKLALKFSKGVPLPVMMAEHRRILQKYSK